MRKVIYTVKNDERTFATHSYAEATKVGNKIIKTDLISVPEDYLDTPDEIKAREKDKMRIASIRERRIAKMRKGE